MSGRVAARFWTRRAYLYTTKPVPQFIVSMHCKTSNKELFWIWRSRLVLCLNSKRIRCVLFPLGRLPGQFSSRLCSFSQSAVPVVVKLVADSGCVYSMWLARRCLSLEQSFVCWMLV